MTSTNNKKDKPTYYKLDVASLPDQLFNAEVPVEKWLDLCETTTSTKGFDKLNKVHPLPWDVEVERLFGIALYMLMNVFPFLILPLLILYFGVATPGAQWVVLGIVFYTLTLVLLETFVFQPMFLKKYNQTSGHLKADPNNIRQNQYNYTERNTTKYLSTSLVWPQSIHPPALHSTPVLFCVVPHGVAPFGITAYPFWSKVWNDKLCRWTTAPIVLRIPIIGMLLKKIGYIPAKAPNILKTLTDSQQNVGIILDGIAGMFHQAQDHETAFLKQRKGVVKIALKAGVPIVPVYAFGHTEAYKVIVDPFGILEKLSNALQASLTPFLGRWGWPLGPPKRIPITMCLGNPVYCPKTKDPNQQQINEYHAKLLQGYQEVFDQHKEAYGWKDKKLYFV